MFQISYKRIGIALVGMLMSLSSLFGALPAGYTQLAFLESSGTQYIDTGVVFGKTNGFSITYQVVAPDLTGNQIICGSRNDDGDTRCILGCNSPVYRTYMTNGTDVVTNSFRQSLAYVGWNDLKFSMSTGHRVDDYTKGVADVNFRNSGTYDCRHAKSGGLDELTAQTAPFYLFAGKMVAPTETMYYGRCRIWEARISAGADVIRHFVAARRESDSELGMYDLVNDVFYTNQGTGIHEPGDRHVQGRRTRPGRRARRLHAAGLAGVHGRAVHRHGRHLHRCAWLRRHIPDDGASAERWQPDCLWIASLFWPYALHGRIK